MYRLQHRFGLRATQRAVATDPRHASDHRASRDRAQPGLELGHHLAADGGARAVPLPLPRDGRLEPPHRRLGPSASARRPDLAATLIQRICVEARASTPGPRAALGQRQADARRDDDRDAPVARRRAVLQPTACLQRQPVLRGALPHAQAHAGLSLAARSPASSRRVRGSPASSPGTTARIVTAGSATSRPTSGTSAASTAVLARRHAIYERAPPIDPARWSRATRNWTPVGTVVLNPEPPGPRRHEPSRQLP